LNAGLIVQSALLRHESRGLHFSKDYPEPLANPQPTILSPKPSLNPFLQGSE
jgi:L-aspartate oxidase